MTDEVSSVKHIDRDALVADQIFVERFLKKLNKTNSCWLWEGAKSSGGYGFAYIKRKPYHAHRISWAIHCGYLPSGLCVLHTCDVRLCVNPSHLFLGTVEDNNRDRDIKGRGRTAEATNASIMSRILKTHCKHGHELTDENIYYSPARRRNCKMCRSIFIKRYRSKNHVRR